MDHDEAMSRDTLGLDSDLSRYLADHSEPPDHVQRDLIDATAELGLLAQMQIGATQGAFIEVLVGALAPTFAVEIGTFTGYSSISIAKSLPPGGTLLCCDVSEEWTAVARAHWERAGLDDRIRLEIAPALETLDKLPDDQQVDFAFIDANKTGYVDYYEALVPRLTPTGLLAVDNTMWSGQVIDTRDTSEDTEAIRRFNDHAAADPRTVVAMLSVDDGVTLIRKR